MAAGGMVVGGGVVVAGGTVVGGEEGGVRSCTIREVRRYEIAVITPYNYYSYVCSSTLTNIKYTVAPHNSISAQNKLN